MSEELETEVTSNEGGARTPELLQVFISYRADLDAPVASALKRLIEGAITPQPMVFVAGDGGLRPSNVGFKRQLQAAAQNAHAFVAIITNASKDREWIFFEAGAAWGRDLMYAPVLVGARPEDLPSTIGDYQALNGQSKDDMFRLVTTLAQRTGAEIRERFGQRYQAFARAVDEHLQGTREDKAKEGGRDDVFHAFLLALQGETERSNEIFDQLEESATDFEEKCRIKIFRLRGNRQNVRLSLEKFDYLLKQTSAFNYTMAIETERPRVKGQYLRRAIDIGGHDSVAARLELARLQVELGENQSAIESLLNLIEEHPGTFAERASSTLVELWPGLTPFERLMILLAGLSGTRSEGYQQISELASEAGWKVLWLYCASRVDALEGTGTSANAQGIARERLNLNSLAFESFARAAKLGVSVARCNMANRVGNEGTAAAALEILNEHKGTSDAADPGYPHDLKGRLERVLHEEREREKVLLKTGEHQFNALWALAEKAIATRHATREMPSGRLVCSAATVVLADSEVCEESLGPHRAERSVTYLRPAGHNLFSVEVGGGLAFVSTGDDIPEGVFFQDFPQGTGLEWFVWQPRTSLPCPIAPKSEDGDG